MDFSTMQSKLESHAYRSVADLECDFNLMISNCLLYNTKDTIYHRTALRLRELGGAVLRHAQRQATNTGFDEGTGMLLPQSPQKRDFYSCTWEDGERAREKGFENASGVVGVWPICGPFHTAKR